MPEQPLCASTLTTLREIVVQSRTKFKIAVIGPDQYIKDFLNLIGIKSFTKNFYDISTHKNNITFVVRTDLFVDIDFAIILDMHHSHVCGTIPPSLQSLKYSKTFLTKSPFTPIIYVRINSDKNTCTSAAINKLFTKTQDGLHKINSYKLRDYYYDIPTSDWNSIICINVKTNKYDIINDLCYPVRIHNLCKLCAVTHTSYL
jgi:hypothetical protein